MGELSSNFKMDDPIAIEEDGKLRGHIESFGPTHRTFTAYYRNKKYKKRGFDDSNIGIVEFSENSLSLRPERGLLAVIAIESTRVESLTEVLAGVRQNTQITRRGWRK